MTYDFDQSHDRCGTSSLKWDFHSVGDTRIHWQETDRKKHGDRCLLPLWVADMDFPAPQPVIDALTERAQHGIYGYSVPTPSYYDAVRGWLSRRQGYAVEQEWIVPTPGVVPALHVLVRGFTAPGDKVLVQPPVYYPFYSSIEHNMAAIWRNPLILRQGRYTMDFDDLRRKAAEPGVRMIILCNPHNPVARCWTKAELSQLADICIKHNILIISDEIHGDLVYKGKTFTPLASLGPDVMEHAVICTAPSKTFNLAGLHTSNIIIPNQKIRDRYRQTLRESGLPSIGAFGLAALEAAYTAGDEWLDQALDYIGENLRYLEDYVAREMPRVSVIPPEGTYLVWMDFRRLGLDRQALESLILGQARVYLDDGYLFGDEGDGFQRVNIACPRALLAEALQRIKLAVDSLP